MPHRDSSPALSENEFDITEALFKDTDDLNSVGTNSKDDDGRRKPKRPLKEDAHNIGLDLEDEDDGVDDELFIAAQQAASNRKTSNVKGRSVKKGGGFQAMGMRLRTDPRE